MTITQRYRLALRLAAIATATGVTAAALPGTWAPIAGISYVERHVTASSFVGSPMGSVAPRIEERALVVYAAGRERRDVLSAAASDGQVAKGTPTMNPVIGNGDYQLADSINGSIMVHVAAHTFSAGDIADLMHSITGVANVGARMTVQSMNVGVDSLGPGDVIDGHATRHYRVNESSTIGFRRLDKCASAGVAARMAASGGPAFVVTTTMDYWIAAPAAFPALARERLAVARVSRDSSRALGLAMLQGMMGGATVGKMAEALRTASTSVPQDWVVLRSVKTQAMDFGTTGMQTTLTDTVERSAIKAANVDESRLVLPAGFTEVSTIPSWSGVPPATPSPVIAEVWRAMPKAVGPAGTARSLSSTASGGSTRGLSKRGFTITPAVSGKTTWNLDVDGPLDLDSAGTWTIVPQSTFTSTTMLWGGGGGAAFSGNGAGGGGGYSTGTVTFQSGASYTLIVGAGGQGAEVPGCGGDGGFGGGGAGGGVQPPGAGLAGTPFSTGGAGQLGSGSGSGAGGGGGGLSGLFSGLAPNQQSALLVAGGGGGATYQNTSAGAGGGEQGETGVGPRPGGPGTQTTGGQIDTAVSVPDARGGVAPPPIGPPPPSGARGRAAGAPMDPNGGATAGGVGSGGGGGYAQGGGAGGGGGGGFFGGGGGGAGRGGGGGGSGFIAPSIAHGATTTGSGSMPGNATAAGVRGSARGATETGQDGIPGRVLILP